MQILVTVSAGVLGIVGSNFPTFRPTCVATCLGYSAIFSNPAVQLQVFHNKVELSCRPQNTLCLIIMTVVIMTIIISSSSIITAIHTHLYHHLTSEVVAEPVR